MKSKGRRQSENMIYDFSLTGTGSYDGRGYRTRDSSFSGGQLTRNGNVYDSRYDSRVANERNGHGGNGASRVICTYFLRKGMLGQMLWRADMEFTFRNLSRTTIRGYHFWAIPYVKLMRRSRLAERLMLPIARARAEELAFQTGISKSPNFLGKLVRIVGEPLCYVIGLFVGEQNWKGLWDRASADEISRAGW